MSEQTEFNPANSSSSSASSSCSEKEIKDSSKSSTQEFTTNQSASAIPNPPENPANTVPSKTLWMGDLEAWWDEAYVAQIWDKLNKHVEVKVIKPKNSLLMHQLAKTNGQGIVNHSGYCFIEFESPELAKEALTLNGTPIPDDTNNKSFRLNWASAATLDSQVAQTPEYSLFVGDLSTDTTEAHLLALFQSHFDSIKTVRVMTDPSSGLSRCFGFVRFTNDDDRKKALVEMNGQWLGGRQIRVALASPKHQSNVRNKFQQFPNQFNPQFANHISSEIPHQNYHQSLNQEFDDPTNTTVFVGGLANGLNEDTLMALFEAFGPIIDIKVPPGKGCGFVKFIERKDAENAIEGLHGFIIGGSRIRLSWGRPNKSRIYHNHQQQHNPHMQHIPPMSMGMNMGIGMNMIPPNSMNSMNMSFSNMSLKNNDAMSPPPGIDTGFMQGLPHPMPQCIPQMAQGMPPQGMHQGLPQGLPPQGIPQGMPGMSTHFIYDPYFGNAAAAPPPPPPSGIDDGQPHFMYVPPGFGPGPTMDVPPQSSSPELHEEQQNNDDVATETKQSFEHHASDKKDGEQKE